MYYLIAAVLLVLMCAAVSTEMKWWRKRLEYSQTFSPRVIPNMEPLVPGDIVRCVESHSGFTTGNDYKVRIAYESVPIVYNDEYKAVIAAGLNPEKFERLN